MTQPTIIEDASITKLIEPFLTKGTINRIRCVDERPEKTQDTKDEKGVQLPGACYGILDAIKTITNCKEEEARKKAKDAHIPWSIHDDEHHGALGCGYGKLVQTESETVLAPEAVAVAERFAFVSAQPIHEILTLIGDHNPKYAIINYREGTTIHSPKAVEAGVGSFNFDYWAAVAFGKQLRVDGQQFATHLLEVYTKTVMRLTNNAITTFYTIR